MDRMKLIEAIVDQMKKSPHVFNADSFREAFKRIPDADLLVFANDIGVDTDKLFAVPQ